ncbi:hypothetical protein BGX29_000190 [Mortierella sp. GBA35]|nr:hypothetical protein BGX29_000190 [Mortierella sp. GBA35]
MAIWGMSSVTNDDDVMDDSNPLSCFTLNRTQRIYGFGIWYVFEAKFLSLRAPVGVGDKLIP